MEEHGEAGTAREAAATEPDAPGPASGRVPSGATGEGERGRNMLPARGRRRLGFERVVVRLIATLGVIGIGVALGAILTSSRTQGWVTGLVVSVVTVVLSAILWSSRQL